MKVCGLIQILLVLIALIPLHNFADCESKTMIGSGDWKGNVLSAEQRIKLLESELRLSLQGLSGCDQTSTDSTAAASQDSNSQTEAVALPASGNMSANGSENPQETGEVLARDQVNDPLNDNGLRRSASSQRVDVNVRGGNVSSEEDELRKVLLEAIERETDPVKRRALIERYEQLFGAIGD
jgi:ribosomal protein S9